MKNNILFKGIMPALITPLNDDGTVKIKAVEPLIKWMCSQGVDGFYVLGGTGEGAVICEKERMKMAEICGDIIKSYGKKFILHVGDSDTQAALRLSRHANTVGADAVSSVYPNFFCNYKLECAKDYYKSLICSSGLPMLGYCSNMIQSQNPYDVVKNLMEIDGMIGIKYTFPDYHQMQKIKKLNNGNINVINGPDQTLICGLAMGADGGIGATYNVLPALFVKVYDCVQNNDLHGAMDAQEKINRLITIIQSGYDLISSVKFLMEFLGFDSGNPAFPGHRMDKEERNHFISDLKNADILPVL